MCASCSQIIQKKIHTQLQRENGVGEGEDDKADLMERQQLVNWDGGRQELFVLFLQLL